MEPVRFDPDDLAGVLPAGGLTLVSGCAAESRLLADAIDCAGARLGPMTFSGIFIPGLNRRTYQADAGCKVLTFFMTPELRAPGAAVEFLPLCYQDVLSELRRRRPQAAVFMCAPPNAQGNCSFGVQVDFLAELWPEIPVRIAHINPAMPVTRGDTGIPFTSLTAYCEAEEVLLTGASQAASEQIEAIARRVQAYITDGATLQLGVGKIPGAILRGLVDRRGLHLHSGLIGEEVLDLIEAGGLAPGRSATVGVAIGSRRLYDVLGEEPFQFRPVSVTHGAATLGRIDNLVTINSAREVDLLGQVYAEMTPAGLMSGPGGASDFARGARLASGLRIVALPAEGGRGGVSRIVAPGQAWGPVSLGRMDVDLIVTEHGVADWRGKSYPDRASALIAVASTQFRDQLTREWSAFSRKL